MHPRVLALMSAQHGLITHTQATGPGRMEPHEVQLLVRSGEWIAVRRGVYMYAATWAALDEHRGRRLAGSRAAHYAMQVPHVMSHDSAALEWDLALLRQHPELVHVTRPDVLGSRTECGVKHHGAAHRADQVVMLGGIDVLEPSRVAVDVAREHGVLAGVVTCDSALQHGVTRADLWSALSMMRYWPGVRSARRSVELADPGAESPGETLTRMLLTEMGLGPIETQFAISDGTRWARCDLRVGRHIFEFDGQVKYHRADAGGLADRAADQVVWQEKRRQDWVCGLGLGMSRVTWSDVHGPGRDRARARLRREYDLTLARWGVDIGELAPYVVRRAS